jgi:type II secretory pathway pseudopilin PulG
MKNSTANPMRGFTLVELLVIIGTIAILATILLPVLASAKARAQRTTCLNNLKQINLGIRLYADENSDMSPNLGNWTYITYREAIKGYAGLTGPSSPNDRIFACPVDTSYVTVTNLGVVVPFGRHMQSFFDYSSYAFNGANLVTNYSQLLFPEGFPGIGGQKISSIKNPVRTLLAQEAACLLPWSWHRPQPPSAPGVLSFNNAWNIVSYVDGHANYTRIYWNSTLVYPDGAWSFADFYDPPPSYDYQWSGN